MMRSTLTWNPLGWLSANVTLFLERLVVDEFDDLQPIRRSSCVTTCANHLVIGMSWGLYQTRWFSRGDLFIPDRWRSLSLWMGHLIIPKRSQRIARELYPNKELYLKFGFYWKIYERSSASLGYWCFMWFLKYGFYHGMKKYQFIYGSMNGWFCIGKLIPWGSKDH